MGLRIQIIIAIGIVSGIVLIVNLVRKKALELRYALIWFAVGIVVLILSLFPSVIVTISRWMGIATPINMLFFAGFCFSLIIILGLTIAISRMSIRVKKLAQALAILESECKKK